MADTFEEIYKSTSLGATQLDDGEETILTTNSSTRYVIKDMYVSGTSNLANTYLELNGVRVSGIQTNATGSLIIPPSSTLKIKTTDYPYRVYENLYWATESSQNDLGVYIDYEDANGSAVSVTGGNIDLYGTGISGSDITDVIYLSTTQNGNGYVYTTRSDGNSSHYIMALPDTNLGSQGTYDSNGSYRPYGFYDGKVWQLNGSTLQYSDFVNTDSVTAQFTNFSPNGLKTNVYNPYPSSSYPRVKCSNGWFWYCVSESYRLDIWGIKLYGSNSGAFVKLRHSTQHLMGGNQGQFTVSVDPVADQLITYRAASNSTYIRETFDNWSSTINTTNSSSITNYTSSSSNTLSIQHQLNSNFVRSTYSHLADGGFSFKNTSNELVKVSVDGTQTKVSGWLGTAGNSVSQLASPNNGFNLKQEQLTSSQMTSLGISAPTFSLMLLGVKST
ncbi:hypothetical protein CRP113_gp38 [Roseobacter phage CRP-113]|uniref:Tail fiber protein n=1 Tax=Roseobacter phage CRP-113 TaxID=3072841 RepID=A0AAX3ZYI9_9CAUD|nr:hypothetical protein CRP113_gp38 [Roseobacter phage CRP-113]